MSQRGFNKRIPVNERVWRELFPPKIGEWVVFTANYKGKKREFLGFVIKIWENEDGSKAYNMEIARMQPIGAWIAKPDRVTIKGNQRLQRVNCETHTARQIRMDTYSDKNA